MRYHNITKDDMLNGDGLRVVLWVAGCEHHCKGCQNPVTWDINSGIPFDDSAKSELFDQLDKPYISGLTLSGGDPLHPTNRTDIFNLIYEVKTKYPDKTIWLYTGYLWEDIKDIPTISKFIDVVCDGRFIQALKDNTIPWVGSSNQRVIKLKEKK